MSGLKQQQKTGFALETGLTKRNDINACKLQTEEIISRKMSERDQMNNETKTIMMNDELMKYVEEQKPDRIALG